MMKLALSGLDDEIRETIRLALLMSYKAGFLIPHIPHGTTGL